MRPLEDLFNDILTKSVRGLGLSDEEVARRAGIPWADFTRLKGGQLGPDAPELLRKVAPVLQLGAEELVASASKSWIPEEPAMGPCFRMYSTPYHSDIIVNSYLVWDTASRTAVAFDTGTDCDGMLGDIARHDLRLEMLLLTHSHNDHIMEIDRLLHKTGCTRALIGKREPVEGAEASVEEGSRWSVGALMITARETWGHSAGGITYLVEGLRPAITAFVGDSIFAGSMGGGNVSYRDALRNNLEKILTLPDDTALCSGHGPLTTVAQEKLHNPFFSMMNAK